MNAVSNNNKHENKHMARKEEPTKAPTPDKLDRSHRDKKNKTADGELKPYPLTEEEATPNTPRSEQSKLEKGQSEKTHITNRLAKSNTRRKLDDDADSDVARDGSV